MPRKPLLPSWPRDVIVAATATAIGKCEDKPNDSVLVRWFLKLVGWLTPAFWCMASVSRDFERACRHRSPLLLTASCEQQRQRAIANGALVTREKFDIQRALDPLSVAGWVGLCIGPDDQGKPHAHHTFIVGVLSDDADIVTRGPRNGFLTVEGNAANPKEPGSRNGDGKYEGRERGHPDDHIEYQFIDPAAYP